MSIATLTSNESGANSLIDINANFVDLDTTKADLASPTFTGLVTSPAIKLTTGAGANKILTSDADGDATWEANTGLITIETGTSATQSLTTTAGQKVIVWAKGSSDASGSGTFSAKLKYGGVEKDTIQVDGESNQNWSLMYTETPGAATADITIDGGPLADIKIIVMKIG